MIQNVFRISLDMLEDDEMNNCGVNLHFCYSMVFNKADKVSTFSTQMKLKQVQVIFR